MSKTQEVVDLAIERHDIDANEFQETYEGNLVTRKSQVFLYGRAMVLEELFRVLDTLPKGSKVLDVGCGTGHLTKNIQEKGYEVHGMEPSENMFDHAVKNFPDIEFKKGISSDLPYGENEFDMVVAFEVLRYLDKTQNVKTYDEFYRVLKPGGKFFVTHVNRYCSDKYYAFYYLKDAWYKLRNKTHHFCFFTTPKEQEEMVSNAKFSRSEIIGRMHGFVRLYFKQGLERGKKLTAKLGDPAKQRFLEDPLRGKAGHLIVVGTK